MISYNNLNIRIIITGIGIQNFAEYSRQFLLIILTYFLSQIQLIDYLSYWKNFFQKLQNNHLYKNYNKNPIVKF